MLKNNKKDKAKASKSRNKRILNIYSSQNAQLELLPKGTSLPLKKVNKSSVPNLNTRTKQTHKKQKVKHSCTSTKPKPIEIYQKIPLHFVNSNTNSDIQFSNYGETRSKPFKKTLHIDCDQEALIKQIWRQDKKKDNLQQKAAIKIQKVFRGYLTRKLLMKYVEEYEEKLLMEREIIEKRLREKYEKQQIYMNDSKKQYFPSKKQEILQQQWQSQRYNPLDFESSIMVASRDNSIHQEIPETNTYDRREIENQRDSLTLNESLIARQHQISMSFGQQNQYSPHFMNINKRRNSKDISRSPKQEELKPTHYISQDKTGDGFSQNISSCPSYSKPYKKLEQSRMSSMREQTEMQRLTQRQSIHLQNLRSIQKAKWQQVIQLVNDQMKQGINQQKTKQLMSYILEFSVKNREELNHKPTYQITPTTITERHEDIQQQHQQDKQIMSFKKKKWKQTQEIQKIQKNENLPLLRKPKEDKTILQRTSNMKQYFLKNLCIQDQQVDKMMSIRQAVLRRKQSNSLIQLNNLLQSNSLTQDDFLQRMSSLTNIFLKHKKDIEQTKDQIYQGYRAQLQLFKNTILDAKYLGYHIPFCRSMEIYPNNSQWRFDEVMIDQLNQRAAKRVSRPLEKDKNFNMHQLSTKKIDQLLQNHSAFKEEEYQHKQIFNESQSEEDSANFSYEQTNIYNNPQTQPQNQLILSPKNMKKINTFNRYATIAIDQDFYRQGRNEKKLNNSQQKQEVSQEDEQDEEEYISLKRMPKKQTFKIEYSSDEEEEALYQESNDKQTEDIVTYVFNKLLYDLLEEMFKNIKLVGSFNFTKNKKIIENITKQQRLSFIQQTTTLLPSFQQIQGRLNQKMYPNAKELLVSMREQQQQNESQHQYYQIGQYEYILNQEICFQSIDTYIEKYKQSNRTKRENRQTDNSSIGAELEMYSTQKLQQYIKNYSKVLKNKQEQFEQLRSQVLKIELHLVLDAWNELLIKHRQSKIGYSGIGLNQISFSLIDRVCKPMKRQQQWLEMIRQTRGRLQQIIKNDQLHQKLIKQYEQFVSQNDSQWILYAQQGLQYGFDLTKAVEVELIFELLEELHHLNQQRQRQQQEQEQQPQPQPQHKEQSRVEFHQRVEQLQDEQSLSSSEHLELNQNQQQELQKKMENMNNLSDSDDSFYD